MKDLITIQKQTPINNPRNKESYFLAKKVPNFAVLNTATPNNAKWSNPETVYRELNHQLSSESAKPIE